MHKSSIEIFVALSHKHTLACTHTHTYEHVHIHTCTCACAHTQDIIFAGDEDVTTLPEPSERFEELLTRHVANECVGEMLSPIVYIHAQDMRSRIVLQAQLTLQAIRQCVATGSHDRCGG